MECAKMLGVRTLTETPETLTSKERLARMTRRVTGKRPAEQDLALLQKTLDALRTRYQDQIDDAKALLQQETSSVPDTLDPRDVAAWMQVANAVLNLDQTLVRE